jgi:hypothetical protein
MHQIGYLAAIELPVVGDPVYGRADAALGRQFLHAAESRSRTITGDQKHVEAPTDPRRAGGPVPEAVSRDSPGPWLFGHSCA